MMLTAFVVAQIAFDVIVVALVVLYVLDRRATTSSSTPPDWYGEVVNLAQDVMAATEPVLDKLDERRAPVAPAPPPPPPAPDRYAGARTLLLAGTAPEDVAAREQLSPAELKLLTSIVATQARLASAAQNGSARE
jgi:hypothetical protein